MQTTITAIHAEEIADSRTKPTVQVTVRCGDIEGTFGVPSGASTGSTEATELRDADGHVSQAVRNINELIAPALVGQDAVDQKAIDDAMLTLDGTEQKSRLGGNAMIGVSIAVAKAAAAAKEEETFQHLRTLAQMTSSRRVPYLYMNYINGEKYHGSASCACSDATCGWALTIRRSTYGAMTTE
jgi:enolase